MIPLEQILGKDSNQLAQYGFTPKVLFPQVLRLTTDTYQILHEFHKSFLLYVPVDLVEQTLGTVEV